MPEAIEGTAVEEGAELVPSSERNLFHTDDPVQVLAAAKRVATALKTELEEADMVRTIGGRPGYVLAEGWQTLAAMLGLTVRIAWTRPLEDGTGFAARAEVLTADGRTIGGAEALCSGDERNWSRRDASAKLSMAQTRATTKALRTVLAFVMTLSGHEATPAEEMAQASEPELPAWAQPADKKQIGRGGKALVTILRESREAAPTDGMLRFIGNGIREMCDGDMPVCVAAALELVAAAIEDDT